MIDVALSANQPFLPHAAVVLRSLLLSAAAPGDVRAHLLHGPEVPSADVDLLAGMVGELGGSLVPHEIDEERLDDLPSSARFTLPTWYRTLLPELLPDALRVLYLDCDTVVLDDVAPLVHVDLGGCALAAVDNISMATADDEARVGLDGGARYFNAGVLVLDLEVWRRERLAEQVRSAGRSSDPAPYLDQDALNRVLGRRRRPLHLRWNCQNSVFYLSIADDLFPSGEAAEARRDPGIVHFEGFRRNKPWHHLSRHPYRDRYLEHRAHTPWPADVIEGRTLLNRVLRPLPHPVVGRVLHARSWWTDRRRRQPPGSQR